MGYVVKVPIAGYSYVEVDDATTAEEAKKKALDMCCDFNNKNVTMEELCGYEKLVEGNVCYAPCWNMEVVDEY